MTEGTMNLFADKNLEKQIREHARIRRLIDGEILMLPGDKVVFVPIVLKGALRIVREDDEGREVFLYHLYATETCAMAVHCCEGKRESMVKAIAEEDTEVLLVPHSLLETLSANPEWQDFIRRTFSKRFAELMEVIDLIAFNNLDKKILNYLEKKQEATRTNVLYITHQQIATELNTHREAVSRLLRTMEKKGMLRLGRNTIEMG